MQGRIILSMLNDDCHDVLIKDIDLPEVSQVLKCTWQSDKSSVFFIHQDSDLIVKMVNAQEGQGLVSEITRKLRLADSSSVKWKLLGTDALEVRIDYDNLPNEFFREKEPSFVSKFCSFFSCCNNKAEESSKESLIKNKQSAGI